MLDDEKPSSSFFTDGGGASLTAPPTGCNLHVCRCLVVLLIDADRMIYWLSVKSLLSALHCDTHTHTHTHS